MERIDFQSNIPYKPKNDKKEKKKIAKKGPFAASFSEGLGKATNQQGPIDFINIETESTPLVELLDDIHTLGDKLKENPSFSLIKEYKEAVRGFVAYVVKNSLKLEKTTLKGFRVLKRKGKPQLTIVQIVDRKLESLAAEILRNQKDQLHIIEKVNELEGLLIDLLS